MIWTAEEENLNEIIHEAEKLRERLHMCPEASGCEFKTKQILTDYLRPEKEGTALRDMGKWFYLCHTEEGADKTIAFRADMDAVTGPDGVPYHGCGHDGHSSVMAALAGSLEGKKTGKNLIFLFQHAEETGEGAAECLSLFKKENVDRMFAFHNIPGFPEGCVMLREGTFACASRGLSVRFAGKQSHAAYPELGNNPVYPMGQLIACLPELTDPADYRGMTLLTPVFMQAGAEAYGVSAGEGKLCFTLRAWYDEDLNRLEERIVSCAKELAEQAGITVLTENRDVFSASMNDREALAAVRKAAEHAGLPVFELKDPMRWSEDFGRFGAGTKTCMVGIGGGSDAAGLHTPEYRWNKAVTETAVRLLGHLIDFV